MNFEFIEHWRYVFECSFSFFMSELFILLKEIDPGLLSLLLIPLLLFFSILVSFQDHSRITGLQGKEEGISLIPHYHLHPLYGHLDISR